MNSENISQNVSQKPKTSKGCAIAILISMVAIFIMFLIILITPSTEDSQQDGAFYMSHAVIEKYLKSPSSAKFPKYEKNFVKKVGENTYQIDAYVDSQNGFGAMLRSKYTVKMKKVGDDWHITHIVLNNKQIK